MIDSVFKMLILLVDVVDPGSIHFSVLNTGLSIYVTKEPTAAYENAP